MITGRRWCSWVARIPPLSAAPAGNDGYWVCFAAEPERLFSNAS
jgi:hypothetical protein